MKSNQNDNGRRFRRADRRNGYGKQDTPGNMTLALARGSYQYSQLMNFLANTAAIRCSTFWCGFNQRRFHRTLRPGLQSM